MKFLAWRSLSRDFFTPRLAYFAPISLRLRLLGAGFSLQMSFQLHKPTLDFFFTISLYLGRHVALLFPALLSCWVASIKLIGVINSF
jgi:hypothetical protein